jgi:3-hydroxyisobutyrate dehydrogenase-like beta-hydroxyacid dehydrogenase
MNKRVGFIGLGNMGTPMTQRLIEAGYEVWGYDVRPELVEALREAGGRGAVSIGKVAENTPVILLCLPDSNVVEIVIEGEGG